MMSMAYFLAKTDPDTYPIDQLEKDHKTVWDGVRNPQAVKAIRSMKPGDKVFIYHSMGQAAVLGLAKVLSEARDDPKDPKSAVVDLEFLFRFPQPTTLTEIKATQRFNDWSLVRQSRLSTMAAPEDFVDWMRLRFPKSKI
jgi:predicted RNA-binding protein with PUA-like domain